MTVFRWKTKKPKNDIDIQTLLPLLLLPLLLLLGNCSSSDDDITSCLAGGAARGAATHMSTCSTALVTIRRLLLHLEACVWVHSHGTSP